MQPTAEIHLDNDNQQYNQMVYPSGGVQILHNHSAPTQSPLADTSDLWRTSYGVDIHTIDMGMGIDKPDLDYVLPSQRVPTWTGA